MGGVGWGPGGERKWGEGGGGELYLPARKFNDRNVFLATKKGIVHGKERFKTIKRIDLRFIPKLSSQI